MVFADGSVLGQLAAASVFALGGVAAIVVVVAFGLDAFALGFAAYVGGWAASLRLEARFRSVRPGTPEQNR